MSSKVTLWRRHEDGTESDPRMMEFHRQWGWMAAASLEIAILGVPTRADACENKKLCVKYTTHEFQDNDDALGAEPLGSIVIDPSTGVGQRLVNATGARVTIIRPPPESPLGLHLDEDGCIEFPTQFAAGHQVVVHPDALVGAGQDVRIIVNDWNGAPNFDISDDNLQAKPGDICNIPPIADGSEVWCSPSEYEHWATMAVATHFINKLDALAGSPLSGEVLNFVFLHNAPGYAFYSAEEANLALGPGTPRHRFLVAHEMGHWIHSRVQVAEGGSYDLRVAYSYPAACHENPGGPDPACEFAVVYDQPALDEGSELLLKSYLELHGIRSSEYSNGAMIEGFAQFAAAVAFNDITQENGEFVYYKDIDDTEVPAYQDFVQEDGYRVALPGSGSGLGGTVAWVRTQCTGDWNTLYGDDTEQIPTAISSEIDWLRFFWEFLTSKDTSIAPQPGFWEVPQILAHALIYDINPWQSYVCPTGGFGEMRVWEPLVNTLTNDPGNADFDLYLNRFVQLNGTHGVWHDPNE